MPGFETKRIINRLTDVAFHILAYSLIFMSLVFARSPAYAEAQSSDAYSAQFSQIINQLGYIDYETFWNLVGESVDPEDQDMLETAGVVGTTYLDTNSYYYPDLGIHTTENKYELTNLTGGYSCTMTFIDADTKEDAYSIVEALVNDQLAWWDGYNIDLSHRKLENRSSYIAKILVNDEAGYVYMYSQVGSCVMSFASDLLLLDSSSGSETLFTYYPTEMKMLTSIGYYFEGVAAEERKSEACDYILSSGFDKSGNYYELVANQEESARGFSITMGIIKNNEWILPLTADFPFIGADGLIHVEVDLAGHSGTTLSSYGKIAKHIFFIDTGGFLFEETKAVDSLARYARTSIVYNCDTMQYVRLDQGKGATAYENRLVYDAQEAEFQSGKITSFGVIHTDQGQMVYIEVNDTAPYANDYTFNSFLFNINTLKMLPITKDLKSFPIGPLSEGLIMFSDLCFYNLSGEPVIDLSDFNISADKDRHFSYGIYEFEAKNAAGSTFLVAINTNGDIVKEEKK